MWKLKSSVFTPIQKNWAKFKKNIKTSQNGNCFFPHFFLTLMPATSRNIIHVCLKINEFGGLLRAGQALDEVGHPAHLSILSKTIPSFVQHNTWLYLKLPPGITISKSFTIELKADKWNKYKTIKNLFKLCQFKSLFNTQTKNSSLTCFSRSFKNKRWRKCN